MTATTPPLARASALASGTDSTADLRARRGADRLASLTASTAGLRVRRGGLPAERWLVVAGAVAIPLGLLLILLGWYGSARTALPFEQTPYLISGGLLGLALVVLGSALYFAHWMTLLVREARADREAAGASAERLEAVLTRLAVLAEEPLPVPEQPRSRRTEPEDLAAAVTAARELLAAVDADEPARPTPARRAPARRTAPARER